MAKILNFTVIDIGTANTNRWSIFEIGVVVVKSGKIVDKWSELIDPQTNEIHGSRPADARGKPTFKDIYPKIKRSVVRGRIVSHSPFDEVAIRQACERYGLPMLENQWRDSLTLARKAWPPGTSIRRKRVSSHSLPEIAPILGIRYDSHDASEDARMAAELVLKAAKKIGIEEVNNWLRGR